MAAIFNFFFSKCKIVAVSNPSEIFKEKFIQINFFYHRYLPREKTIRIFQFLTYRISSTKRLQRWFNFGDNYFKVREIIQM